MKTYEEFLEFLEVHLNHITDFVPASNKDFYPVCFAMARFLLSEPYRWEILFPDWPIAPEVQKPSEEALKAFYSDTKGMPLSFRKELAANDLETLYKAYDVFFPLIVTKDEFLTAIFREDLNARRYKKIFRQSHAKIKRVREKIDRLKTEESLIELMRQFTKDLSGFSLTLINNKKLLDQVIQKIMASAS